MSKEALIKWEKRFCDRNDYNKDFYVKWMKKYGHDVLKKRMRLAKTNNKKNIPKRKKKSRRKKKREERDTSEEATEEITRSNVKS